MLFDASHQASTRPRHVESSPYTQQQKVLPSHWAQSGKHCLLGDTPHRNSRAATLNPFFNESAHWSFEDSAHWTKHNNLKHRTRDTSWPSNTSVSPLESTIPLPQQSLPSALPTPQYKPYVILKS
ncbi:hypothetical protein N7537_010514 [Penicillium hordei]|uniref:Uncharacterized protein n=1 Tax=Penicillium hordei TaxID=40994 RepID=A0AAD6GY54_9EURO|nr:uncharacterized protein N7537_010514 [Penicillium hordei]KAJ5593610.1 hypothetical protein N7537_010514 [Penicillium hordei]